LCLGWHAAAAEHLEKGRASAAERALLPELGDCLVGQPIAQELTRQFRQAGVFGDDLPWMRTPILRRGCWRCSGGADKETCGVRSASPCRSRPGRARVPQSRGDGQQGR